MIKETCSCGATLEYTPTGNYALKEGDVADKWRKDHKHETPRIEVPDMKPNYQFSGPIDVRQAEQDEP